jgi:tetratricopeptide (TPR) repeat protein
MKRLLLPVLLLAATLIVVANDAIAQTAKEYCNRGVAKQNKGDLEGAVADYNRAIQLSPYDATPYNNRGLIKTAKGDLDGAIEDFNRALQIDAKNPKTYDNRGVAIQKTGDLAGALQNYDRAIDLSRKFAGAFAHRGYIKMTKGDLDGALSDYNNAIELRLKDADTFYNRGLVKKAKGDIDGAQADFTRAIKLNPKLAEARSDLPVVNEVKKDAGKPVPDQNHTVNVDAKKTEAPSGNIAKQTQTELRRAPTEPSAFDIEPRNIVPPDRRGQAKQKTNDVKTTQIIREITAESKPKGETPSPAPAAMVAKSNSSVRGLVDFGRGLDLNSQAIASVNTPTPAKPTADLNRVQPAPSPGSAPVNAVAYNNAGPLGTTRSNLKSGLPDADSSIDTNPTSAAAYNIRGNTAQAKHDLESAISDYNRAIELDPTYALAYYNRGVAKQTKGDLDGALADYNPAIELDAKNAAAYSSRAVVKQMKGNLDGALADYSSAIELNPKDAGSYNNRAALYFLAHNWRAALNDYNQLFQFSNQSQDFPHLYVWLIRARMGETDAANKELADYLDQRGNAARNDWYSNVASFLLGRASEIELLAIGKIPDDRSKTGHLCEAWFYIGMKKLLAGDKTGAESCFQASVATNQQEYTEYHFAEAELRALGK